MCIWYISAQLDDSSQREGIFVKAHSLRQKMLGPLLVATSPGVTTTLTSSGTDWVCPFLCFTETEPHSMCSYTSGVSLQHCVYAPPMFVAIAGSQCCSLTVCGDAMTDLALGIGAALGCYK